MLTRIKRAVVAGACFIALAAVAAGPGMAADDPEDQLVDVSKQVSAIQKKMHDLLAHGRWARSGELLAGADCGYPDAAQIFSPWGDPAMYALAPQGIFAPSDDWTLDKEAAVVTAADPFSGALALPPAGEGRRGGVPGDVRNLDNPTIRFFSRDLGGNGKSHLKVDVLYEDLDGHVKHLTIAKLRVGDRVAALGDRAHVHEHAGGRVARRRDSCRVQVQGGRLQKDETLSISSLYVDPFSSR